MIVRIMNEGQYRLPDEDLPELNRLDAAVEADLMDPERDFRDALAALLAHVRAVGEALADEELVPSDVVLPPDGASEDEVRELLTDEGLIPD